MPIWILRIVRNGFGYIYLEQINVDMYHHLMLNDRQQLYSKPFIHNVKKNHTFKFNFMLLFLNYVQNSPIFVDLLILNINSWLCYEYSYVYSLSFGKSCNCFYFKNSTMFIYIHILSYKFTRGCRGRDHTVVGFTTTCPIIAYHH